MLLERKPPSATAKRFCGLGLNESPPTEQPRWKWQTQPPEFSAGETRHSFAIWSLDEKVASGRRLHLYYCLRCMWSFCVDDRCGTITPLDLNGKPVRGAEAANRLATFDSGPCPVFSPSVENPRLTQRITKFEKVRIHFVVLASLGLAFFKGSVGRVSLGRRTQHNQRGRKNWTPTTVRNVNLQT